MVYLRPTLTLALTLALTLTQVPYHMVWEYVRPTLVYALDERLRRAFEQSTNSTVDFLASCEDIDYIRRGLLG